MTDRWSDKFWDTFPGNIETASLFHSIIVDGKKEFFKKVCLVLKTGIL